VPQVRHGWIAHASGDEANWSRRQREFDAMGVHGFRLLHIVHHHPPTPPSPPTLPLLPLPRAMNFVGISGADQAQFLALQRSLPHVAVLSADPAGALSSRPQLSLSLLLGFHVLLCVPFLVPTVPFGRPLFLGALTALLTAIVSSTTGLGQAEDYVLSIVCVGSYQRFVAFYVCSPPPERNGLLARKGRDGPPRNWRLADRLAAVCAIYGNCRGIGWAWELRTRGYSSAPAPPRWCALRAPHPAPRTPR